MRTSDNGRFLEFFAWNKYKSIIVQTPTNQDKELTTKDAEIKMVKKQKINVFIDELRIFGNTDSLTLTTSVIEELLE